MRRVLTGGLVLALLALLYGVRTAPMQPAPTPLAADGPDKHREVGQPPDRDPMDVPVLRDVNSPSPQGSSADARTQRRWGVLVETDGSLVLREAHIPAPTPPPFPEPLAFQESPPEETFTGAVLDQRAAGTSADFRAYLQSANDLPPPAFIHLVLEIPDSPAESPSYRPALACLPPVQVLRVIECEEFGEAWLRSWRELYRATCDVETALELPPGPGKRSRILPAVAAMRSALFESKQAREGAAVVSWRVDAETRLVEPTALKLRRIGLDSDLGWGPTTSELQEAFDRSESPGGFRDRLRTMGDFVRGRKIHLRCGLASGELPEARARIESLLALPDELLEELMRDVRLEDAVRDALERDRSHEQRFPQQIPEWIGVRVSEASDEDRARALLSNAAVVTEVLPGMPAASAGVSTGDLIWRATVTEIGEPFYTGGEPRALAIGSAADLGVALSRTEFMDALVTLDVLRGGISMKIEIQHDLSPQDRLREEEKRRREREAIESLNKGAVITEPDR